MKFEDFLKRWYEAHIEVSPESATGYTEVAGCSIIQYLPYTFESFSNSPLAQSARSAYEAALFSSYIDGVVDGALIEAKQPN